MLAMTVLVGVIAVLFAQGYSLPESLIESIRNLPIRNPWFIGIGGYVGLMVFLGCALFLIPRDDVEELEA